MPADVIREAAHTYARADRAIICWTLGITEHHNAVDNVLSLINLALLTGHVGKYGSGVNPLRGQNNVQGGGDMGAIPNRLVGFQDWTVDPAIRAKFEKAWGVTLKPQYGRNVTEMFNAMERGELHALFALGENPAQAEADQHRTEELLTGLDHLVVQDIFLTATAKLAHVVLPASSSWCEAEGTVTNSERRVQRLRKALEPPGNARDDMWIISELARRMGKRLGTSHGRGGLERGPLAGAELRRHELRAARAGRGACSGPATTSTTRASSSFIAGSGATRSKAGRRRSRPSSTIRRSSGPTPSTRSR